MQKKIIWVFGESATGKLTLINNLYNKNEDILNIFDMKNKEINISEITLEDRNKNYGNIEGIDIYDDYLMEESNLFFNKKMAIERRKCIMYDVENFLKNDDDVLLIKGQVNDLNVRRGNIIGYFLNKYYGMENIDIEVFILQVSNKDELIRRIQSKLWFKEMKDEKEKERLLNNIPLKKEEHKELVIDAFNDYNIPICIIESLNGAYRIEGVINGKSDIIRR